MIDAEHGFVIKDLKKHGEQFVIARGGRGGKGNAHFKSSTNRTPRATIGRNQQVRDVILELKSIADVGLVGMPNAGEHAVESHFQPRPEIADYPFTTKHPNLGIVDVNEEKSFVVADIPGLIEGASDGVGLGHEFLRHVERAGLLVHLVEPMPVDGTDPVQNYHAIRSELREYDASLAEREEMVVVTKSELDCAADVRDALAESINGEVLLISAMTGVGLPDLISEIMSRVDHRRKLMLQAGEEIMVLRESDLPNTQGQQKKRLPPHLAGPTRNLSDEVQAKNFDKHSQQPGLDGDGT